MTTVLETTPRIPISEIASLDSLWFHPQLLHVWSEKLPEYGYDLGDDIVFVNYA